MNNNISSSLVKELRKETGLGIMDCKKALIKSNGNLNGAIEILRKQGLSTANKKISRITSEGLVNAYVAPDQRIAAIIEVNCETDFVAKNDSFKKFVKEITILVAEKNPDDLNCLLSLKITADDTVENMVNYLINTFGENIAIKRFKRFEVTGIGVIDAYIHDDYLTKGKIGVLVETSFNKTNRSYYPKAESFIRTLLMQIAATKPKYLDKKEIPEYVLNEEKAILKTLAENEGLSGNILETFIQGKLKKYFKNNCLLEQDFIMDPEKTVGDMIKALNDKNNEEPFSILRFVRYEKGESLDSRS
ncbi:translation elongation factor Ts [Bacillus sp. IITD106]|nr:translation elongation factor Ts [Bacillus sp. IITD106]